MTEHKKVKMTRNLFENLLNRSEKLKEFEAIGTVEEFKALKEKNEPKKVIDIKKAEYAEDIEYFGADELFGNCPHCREMVNRTWNPCSCGDCGGLIDWSGCRKCGRKML